jgi:small-conductance mechanosensitive channel
MEAQSALDAVASAERRSAEIATSTPWYAPWYGVTCAAFPVTIALFAVRSSLGIALLVLGLASLALLVRTYRNHTGVWPSGEGMLTHTVAAIAALLGTALASYLVASAYGIGWWLLAVAVVTAVLMALLSRGYDIAYARKHGAR